jgi:hypothetical protein
LEVLRAVADGEFGDLTNLQVRKKKNGLKSGAPTLQGALKDIYRAHTTSNKRLRYVGCKWDGTCDAHSMNLILYDDGPLRSRWTGPAEAGRRPPWFEGVRRRPI